MANQSKKHGISLESVTFYLDSVERDRLDTNGAGSKAGEVMALRDLLMRLPEEAFRAKVSSIRALISDQDDKKTVEGTKVSQELRDSGRKLFEDTRGGRGAGARGTLGKVTS